MYDENQTFIPDSFLALYQDARKRLTIPREILVDRYDFCESMAGALVERCQGAYATGFIDQDQVLTRCYDGLVEPSSLDAAQARWVVMRLAELLEWNWVSAPPGPDASA